MAQDRAITWRIYYGDGSTFSSLDGTPQEAPCSNVQVIMGYDRDNGRQALHLWDWYYYKTGNPGEWWGCDIHGLLDQLLHDTKGEITAVKQGRTLGNSLFQSIKQSALNDSDFPPTNEPPSWLYPKQVYGDGHS